MRRLQPFRHARALLPAFTASLIIAVVAPSVLSGCAAVAHAVSASTSARTSYIDVSALNLERLLPPPPANDSAETRSELDLMLKIQNERSPAQAARAKADAEVSVYRFADALGNPPAFAPKNLPRTQELFARIRGDEGVLISAVKDRFGRPRPYVLEPRMSPVISTPPNGSYPSGHTTWAQATGLVLADMIPERRPQIMKRAAEYSHNRVVAGVHYPSDIEGGRMAGTVLAAALFASPAFASDYAAAKSELRRALNLPAQLH